MVTRSGCSAIYRRKTTHPAITKAPFGEVGTEAHPGGSHLATTYDLEGLLCDAGSRRQTG